MRINGKVLILGIVVLVMVVIVTRKESSVQKEDINNLDELYQQVANMALSFDSREKFVLDFDPSGFVYEDAMEVAAQTDPYQAANSMAYEWSARQLDNGKWSFSISINFMGTKHEIKKSDKRIKQLCKKMEGMTDYEKVKAIHDYVILYCDYGWDGVAFKSVEQGPYWTLYPGLAVCNGYALTFYRTMQMCDIPVTFEVGDNHAWNTVYIDGHWYNMDLTWDDLGDEVSYEYFLKDANDFKGHHHSDVDAPESMEVTGKTAQENYDMFPDYKFAYRCYLIFLALLPFIILFSLIFIHNKRKSMKRKAWAKRQMEKERDEEKYRDFLHKMSPAYSKDNNGHDNANNNENGDTEGYRIQKNQIQFVNDDFEEFEKEHYGNSDGVSDKTIK